MNDAKSKDQERGPGAEKVDLEKRLDANEDALKKSQKTTTSDEQSDPNDHIE